MMAQYVKGEGRGAEESDSREDAAHEMPPMALEVITQEECDSRAEHAASHGNSDEFGQWKLDLFHYNTESRPPRRSDALRSHDVRLPNGGDS